VLRREGVWSDMASLYDVTEADASSWWYAGERTLADLTATGNAALAWHHTESRTLAGWAEEAWTTQIWDRDRRFTDLLPQRNVTVRDLCLTGNHADQRFL